MIKRPHDMSQLDYLWTTYGNYSVSSVASGSPSSQVILTESAVISLLDSIENNNLANIIYRNNPTNPELAQLVGISKNGEEIIIVDIPKVDNVTYFGATTVTTEDKGCPYEIGTNVLKLSLNSGKSFYFNIDEYLLITYSGGETDTIITEVKDRIITSNLKLKSTDNVVQLSSDSEGVSADLKISSSDNGVSLLKSKDGLSAKIEFANIPSKVIRFEQLTLAEYNLLDVKRQGTVYFLTDIPYIYLDGIKYGLDISAGDSPIVSIIYNPNDYKLEYRMANNTTGEVLVGPASREYSGMLSAEDYSRFDDAYKALNWNDINN